MSQPIKNNGIISQYQPGNTNIIHHRGTFAFVKHWWCLEGTTGRQAKQQRGTMEKLIEAEGGVAYLYHTDDVIRDTE